MQLYLDDSPMSYLAHALIGGSFKKPLGELKENDVYFGEFDFSNVTKYPEHYAVIPLYKKVGNKCLFSSNSSPYYYLDAVVKGKLSYLVTIEKEQYDYYWGNNKDINNADLFDKLLDYAYLAGEETNYDTVSDLSRRTSNVVTDMVVNFNMGKHNYINSRLAQADTTLVGSHAIMVAKADQFLTNTAYSGISYLRIKFPSAKQYTVFVQKDNFVLAMSNCWDEIKPKLEIDSEDTWNTHAFFMSGAS